MEYRVLGPLEVLDENGQKLRLGGTQQQSVLASLLLRTGQTVALERLVDGLWEKPPATASRTVQAYISRLRRELPNGAIESRPGGYTLVADGAELDLQTFERRAAEGHAALAAGENERAASLLREALALWRGPALAGLKSEALRREAKRLEELRLGVLEDRIEAELGAGRHGELVPELQGLVAEHPLRERVRAQLMRALYGAGRPGDALAVYREGRRLLVDELGMEPGKELRELEQAILRQDAGLEAPELQRRVAPAEPLAPEPELPIQQTPPRIVRKTVTVLSCDVVGSTALGESTDPEVTRLLLARYFERMKTAVERHGGTVEKFIGDAVMAVFGVPVVHEDDALRACRAAHEMMTQALPELGLQGRIGLNTGEVVTGTEERLATGDALNVAARLQHAAEPGQVLLGEATLGLVRSAVETTALEPLRLKGKAEPVAAYRLLAVHEPSAPDAETTFVGRERELRLVHEAWERALAEQRCELLTIAGEAGVGKSRLVAEAISSIRAQVVQGRCPPYGEGITYWPLVEALKQLEVLPSDPAAAAALRSLLGKSEAGTSAEEIAWAFRKLLEERAPLIVVFDDIQWGEETFLDLIEHVALLSSGAPLLLLCMARPELVDRRSVWPVTLRLEPLPEEQVEELIGERAPAELRERIARAAGGNPLFVSEMLAMAGQAGNEVPVPPTLRALLAARLDQLEPEERLVLERAAVEGEIFHRGAVQALVPEESAVTPRLLSLVRKQLIQPDNPQFPGEDGFRFRHLLIRDAAYDALPKAARAELHERFTVWLKKHGRSLAERDELLGFHLEQAARSKAELGHADWAIAAQAGDRLSRAGRRAFWRGDERAAASLLERALALIQPIRLDIHLEVDLAGTLSDPKRAVAIAEGAAERAAEVGDEAGEALARVEAARNRWAYAADATIEDLERLARRALPLLEANRDHAGLAHVWLALASGVHYLRGRYEECLQASEQMFEHARLAGEEPRSRFGLHDQALVYGPRPADEALRLLDTNVADYASGLARAELLAMLGRFDEAWQAVAESSASYREAIHMGEPLGVLSRVASLAGDDEAAVAYLRKRCDAYEKNGTPRMLSMASPALGRLLCALGRYEEAEPLAELGRKLGDEQDLPTQMLWRQVEALVSASRAQYAPAKQLAKEAVAIGEETDALNMQGDALWDLAEVLCSAGYEQQGMVTLEQALERYERKRNVALAERVQGKLAALRLSRAPTERN
jgi:class 3 adenylate cyclase